MTIISIADLNNAKADVDHIADIATSTAVSVTDRMGNAKSTVAAAIDSIKAFNNRGAWAAVTAYIGKDLVSVSGSWYVCVVPHTSSAAFGTDTASKWRLYQGVTSGDLAAPSGASTVGFMPVGGGVATNVEAALQYLVWAEQYTSLQVAMNVAASGGKVLRALPSSVFMISASLTVPSNLVADLGFCTIKRSPGSVFNMLTNTGGSGIRLSNFTVDGNKSADSRVAANVGDRFGGIVFTSVTASELRNVTVNNTVNAEDGRAGVYLASCSTFDLYNVGGSGNDRSCIYFYQSSVRVFGSYTKNNIGSGITSAAAHDSEYHNCTSVGNGYSGISINGLRSKASNLKSTGTASGFAGVNIGHVGDPCDGSVISDVQSYSNSGWGLFVADSRNVVLTNLVIKDNGQSNIQVQSSSGNILLSNVVSSGSTEVGIRLLSGSGHKVENASAFGNTLQNIEINGASDCSFTNVDAYGSVAQSGVLVAGKNIKFRNSNIHSNAYNGIVTNSAGSVDADSSVHCFNNGVADNTSAGILLNTSTGCVVSAECFDDKATKTQGSGLWLAGGSSNLIGGFYHDNLSYNVRETSSPSYSQSGIRIGSNSTTGSISPAATATSSTVLNNNARAGMLVIFWPLNAAARTLGLPTVASITGGVSFVVNLGGTAVGTEAYQYVIL